jgi:EAL domain-containing protein (putative c-di-GMP-specific phosphodiesterase class I)
MSEVQLQAPPRILLIDDDTDVLRAYARALRSCGYHVDVATTAQDGLDNLGRAGYDAVFSDIVMPGLSGLDLLGAVRGYDPDVPVVLMTGNPRLETAIRAIEHGVARYLVKPISIQELGDTAAWAIRMNTLARSKRQALALTTTPGHRIGDRDTLAVRFSQALERLTVVFQPIVAWPARSVYGYEALLRVRDSAFPTPPDFIAAAERLGRLREVGAAVRQAVARAASEAPAQAALFVNLHPMDLLDESLYRPDAPLARLSNRVVFELTERATLEQIDDLAQRRAQLRELGYHIAVDDLGAGYAGLSSLVSLEPELVKIDMSLIRGVDLDPARQSVVRRIAELVRDLGMDVIAEGVETQAERDMLTRLGCSLLQGYWFARPGPGFPSVDFSRGEP